jgi:hypothetical protein
MGFFSKVKEAFRDKTRDKIYARLRMLGIDAQMAARGRAEENIGGSPRDSTDIFTGTSQESLGLIDIPKGPIRWVNVFRELRNSGYSQTAYYYTLYGVPDPELGPAFPRVRIKSVRVKSFPLVGRVVDLRWEGEDFGLGIISRLNSDYELKHPIMNSRDVIIRAHGDRNCWILSTKTRDAPSQEIWSCYQAIARHLLAM